MACAHREEAPANDRRVARRLPQRHVASPSRHVRFLVLRAAPGAVALFFPAQPASSPPNKIKAASCPSLVVCNCPYPSVSTTLFVSHHPGLLFLLLSPSLPRSYHSRPPPINQPDPHRPFPSAYWAPASKFLARLSTYVSSRPRKALTYPFASSARCGSLALEQPATSNATRLAACISPTPISAITSGTPFLSRCCIGHS